MFRKIDLQWFAEPDPGVPEITFESEEEEGEEVEIEVVPEGEEKVIDPNAPKSKTSEEYEAEIESLKTQANQATAIKEAVEGLGERIATPSQPAPVASVQAPVVDDPGIKDKFNVDVFAENPYGVIKDLVEKVAGNIAKEVTTKQVSQVAGAFAGTLSKNQKALLRSDPKEGPLYIEYEDQVEQEVLELVAQNPAVKNNPELYQYAFNQIKLKNVDKIAQGIADKIMTEKAGVVKPKTQFSERSTGGAGQKPKTKKVVITKSEERYCDLRGLPIKQFAKMKADGASFSVGGELIYE